MVREAWLEWAREQPESVLEDHPGWLVSWEHLSSAQREVDMRIGEELFAAGVAAERDSPPVAARVWGLLDDQPPEGTWCLDAAGDIDQWQRCSPETWQLCGLSLLPLVEVFVPDYDAAVGQDAARRQVIEGEVTAPTFDTGAWPLGGLPEVLARARRRVQGDKS